MSKRRRTYSQETKSKALELLESSGKSAAQIERDLGITKGLLLKWRDRYQVKRENDLASPDRIDPAAVRTLQKEAELQQEFVRLERQLIIAVALDLMVPLTYMGGFLSMLPMVGDLNDRQQEYLLKLDSGLEKISTLVHRILYLRGAEQTFPFLDSRLDIREAVLNAVESLEKRRQEEHREIDLTTEIPPEVPHIRGDYRLVGTVIEELADNAYRYTPDKGSILFRVTPDGTGVQVDVTDNGIGIPEEDKPYIFKKGFHGTKRPVRGLPSIGIGLAIVHNLVGLHGGRVWFNSRENEGSTFSFWLPCE